MRNFIYILIGGPSLLTMLRNFRMFTIDKDPNEPPEIVLFLLGCVVVSCVCYSVYYFGLKFKAWRHRSKEVDDEVPPITTTTMSEHTDEFSENGDEVGDEWRMPPPSSSQKYSDEENEAFRRERKQILEEFRREELEKQRSGSNLSSSVDSDVDDFGGDSGDC